MNGQAESSFIRALYRLRQTFWWRRIIHGSVRAICLALLLPIGVMVGYLGWGRQISWPYWVYPMLLIGAAVMGWAIRPISLKIIVHRLDSKLGLRTRLITAFEVSQADNNADNPVIPRLLQESVALIIELRAQVHIFNRHLWLEIQTLTGVIAILSALILLDALSPRLPNVPPDPLPTPLPEPPVAEVIPPPPQLAPPPFAPDTQIQQTPTFIPQALEALADALRDQSATRNTSAAIDQGDLPAAAESLRRLADQLPELSEEARQAVGQAMQQAAGNIGEGVPGLTDPLKQGAAALTEGNQSQAGQALDKLAAALEALTDLPPEIAAQPEPAPASEETTPAGEPEPNSSPEPAPAGEETAKVAESEPGNNVEADTLPGNEPAVEAEPLVVEGESLELESESKIEEWVLQPVELDAGAGNGLTQSSPFAGSGVNASNEVLGPDLLTYPLDKRNIIRRYFTPDRD
jgi:hypothetical protein